MTLTRLAKARRDKSRYIEKSIILFDFFIPQ